LRPLFHPVLEGSLGLDHLLLDLADVVEDQVHSVEVDLPVAREVVTESGQLVLVYGHDGVDGTFSDMQTGQVRQEIVSDEEAEENEVIDDSLEVKREGQVHVLKLEVEVFTHYVQTNELELDGLSELDISGMATRLFLGTLCCEVTL
jgi:hypothetical protein